MNVLLSLIGCAPQNICPIYDESGVVDNNCTKRQDAKTVALVNKSTSYTAELTPGEQFELIQKKTASNTVGNAHFGGIK